MIPQGSPIKVNLTKNSLRMQSVLEARTQLKWETIPK